VSTGAAGKVTAGHLARSAYLYVRQSTLRQVLTNTESTARQYALRQRAVALGWPAGRVITIDADQGQSGASAADREGFQRLVADVGMGRAGIVLGLEVSRLARNNADWHRLLEICALSGTLICDEDGLYDPGEFNDRLLLGLKGTMSEAELHFIRARLRGGQLSKARRGELKMGLPVGLVYDPADKIVLDPDVSVREAIAHLFAAFARTGSARAVVAEFNTAGLLFPVRIRKGAHKGELAWMPLRHWRVLRTLHNPRYAGAFVYGQRREARNPATGKKTMITVPREQWFAFIPDAHPGYISFEQYEANQAALLGNAQAHARERDKGPAREGTALLQGLAICFRCGRRMSVRYHTRRGVEVPDYQCMRECIDGAARRCLLVPGAGVDAAIGQLLLDTLTRSRSRSRSTCRPNCRPEPNTPTSCAVTTSNAPGTAPASPAAATYPSTPATGWSPTAWRPTGTRHCARYKPPKTNTRRPPQPRPSRSPMNTPAASTRWPATSPPCGLTLRPRSGNASA
jgi:DNA invertase Pin-like site-specific DNA recombinase